VSRTRTGQLALAAAALAAIVSGTRWFMPSDEDRVRAAIAALTSALSSRTADPVGQVAALGRLRARLAEDVVVETGGGAAIRGRDAAAGVWQRLRAGAEATTVRALDVRVVVADDRRVAETSAAVELTRERGGVPERELHDVRATFIAVDGDWLLARAGLEEAVVAPPEAAEGR
jgi:hypothetical protein